MAYPIADDRVNLRKRLIKTIGLIGRRACCECILQEIGTFCEICQLLTHLLDGHSEVDQARGNCGVWHIGMLRAESIFWRWELRECLVIVDQSAESPSCLGQALTAPTGEGKGIRQYRPDFAF